MHLSLADFEALTPDEWRHACQAWQEHEDSRQRLTWERARWLGARLLQPYCRKSLRPADLGTFPWERPETPARPQLSEEQQKERMKAALLKLGRTY